METIFYFQIHQPYRLKWLHLQNSKSLEERYLNYQLTEEIFNKVSDKCYLPATNILLDLLEEYPDFKIVFSFTGVVLDQAKIFREDVFDTFTALKKYIKTQQVEILGETYFHSLSSLFPNYDEFKSQITDHTKLIKKTFNYSPSSFRNTELIYNKKISKTAAELGFQSILTEGADDINTDCNFLYNDGNLNLLLRNYKLSDDIGYRFSSKVWSEYPLTSTKYTNWLSSLNGQFSLIAMDYETFGEHHWTDTGIFNFLNTLPKQLLKNKKINFSTVKETATKFPAKNITINRTVSWADLERDESAWLGNEMQQAAFRKLYSLKEKINPHKDKEVYTMWRKLQSSDHLYYISTKSLSDQDVHNYFSPYNSPFEAFINYMNILNDFEKSYLD
ncbi:glycoside hydrolase family 57 protein [Candidatus Micrarchaeota archaeon]|jgi:alpha-amylase|nr:glycoside hydrolase family 57 protein [Candidatus Micrarchaeota archaeon]